MVYSPDSPESTRYKKYLHHHLSEPGIEELPDTLINPSYRTAVRTGPLGRYQIV